VDAVQAGLPVAAVDDLLARGLLNAEEVDRLVLPRRTLSHRRARGERFTLDESDRLARVARVLAVAEDSFGSADKAGRWLRRPSRGLRGEVPLALVVTTDGARLVEDELTRKLLTEMGCDKLQGFLVSRPLADERLESWILTRAGVRSAVPGTPHRRLFVRS